MQSKIDIIIDVSKNLTNWWVCANVMGVDHDGCGIYLDFPELYSPSAPVTFDVVIDKADDMPTELKASLVLESISADLYALAVEEGFLVKGDE